MKHMIDCFVDGTQVDFIEMLRLGLIKPFDYGYVLTTFGKTFICFGRPTGLTLT